MIRTPLLAWVALSLMATGAHAVAQDAVATEDPDDPVLEAMVAEVDRAMEALSQADPPAYFLAAEVTETRAVMISGEEGGLQGYSPAHNRRVDVDVRVGSAQLDSTHTLRSTKPNRFERFGRDLVVSDDVGTIRRGIWREIDTRFVEAQERWAKVESDRQVLVDEEPAEDLAPVSPILEIGPHAELELDLPAWEETIRQASAALADSPVVHDGQVRLMAQQVTRWFVSSEGTRLRHSGTHVRVSVMLNTVADDGEALGLSYSWDAATPDAIPDRDAIEAKTRELDGLLTQLRAAPDQEPYSGPAVLTGRAAGVFFHEVFGHRVEGHRLKRVDDAQTFRDMVDQTVLPEFLSVYDDPTLAAFEGVDLNGHYRFDNQGVPGERVTLVQDGVLRGFLQSRSPMLQGELCNGHGRRMPGRDAVTRQGNLLITASRTVDADDLRDELLKRVRAEGLEYGLLIDDITGGFTFTGRSMPNAFEVKAVLAWRVHADGRPDQLVRGADLIGTPLVAFSQVELAGDDYAVFNGMCGAESGWVPVSAVAPSLLLAEIETQRKAKGQNMPPLLPPPGREGEEVQP